ncbi:MAG: DnaD domain protein [Eubacteriales bacterium]
MNKYTKNVFIMPRVEEKYLNRAKKSELKILYYIFAHGGTLDVDAACRALEETPESVHAALAFWRCAGILEDECTEDEQTSVRANGTSVPDNTAPCSQSADASVCGADTSVPNVPAPHTASAPRAADTYTLSEITAARDRNAEFASLISYLEKLTGRLYNAAEQGIVLFLYDTLGINYEVIMGVAQYCVSKGKTSVRYIQRTAMNITDEGVKTYAELEAYLGTQKRQDEYRDKVKRIIGAERALSKAECTVIDRWEREGYTEEMVSLAYEKTVAKINKPQIAYMAKILDGWQEKGLKSAAEVEKYFEDPANRAPHTASSGKGTSDGRLEFNLDDIFEKPSGSVSE